MADAREGVLKLWPSAWIEEVREGQLVWFNVYCELAPSSPEADLMGRVKLASGSTKELAWQRAADEVGNPAQNKTAHQPGRPVGYRRCVPKVNTACPGVRGHDGGAL